MRRDKFLENKDFLVLYNRLSTLNKQFILIVFGSQVNGTATKASDLDLLLISNKEDSKLIESEVALSPLKIHLTSTSYGDFIKMLLTKQQTVVSEAIKKNIILFGIEDYYRILNNAR
jgi:predicted nucleotidyltransferase